MLITLDSVNLQWLKDARIFLSLAGEPTEAVKYIGKTINVPDDAAAEPYSCFANGGVFFSMGAHSYSKSAFAKNITVGRFCSIGPGCDIMPADHPLDRISTSGFSYANSLIYDEITEGRIAKSRVQGKGKALPVIGNDVWIGYGAVIAHGIRIGDGAVIGAKSVVTRDVPDYAVVAGSPAEVKKYRFPEKTIEALKALQWWNYHPADYADIPMDNVDEFIARFRDREMRPYNPTKLNLVNLLKTGFLVPA